MEIEDTWKLTIKTTCFWGDEKFQHSRNDPHIMLKPIGRILCVTIKKVDVCYSVLR